MDKYGCQTPPSLPPPRNIQLSGMEPADETIEQYQWCGTIRWSV
jgi:hypothetical protein